MSTAIKYNPELFTVERAGTVSAALGEFIIGVSRLGSTAATAWLPVPLATFTYTSGYTPDENKTLIIDSETAQVSLSYWDDLPEPPLYSLDQVRVRYAGETLFQGTVDSTRVAYSADPAAAEHGATRRIDFSASLVGDYAIALGKTVSWTNLPAEPAIDRVRRWVTVDGWDS